MSGWERLLAARDPLERIALRRVLVGAVREHDEAASERDKALLAALEPVVQRGVAQAFK